MANFGDTRQERRNLVLEYFYRLDRGEEVLSLFDEHAEVYFPKWGVARGVREIEALWGDVGSLYRDIRHYPEYLNLIVGEDLLVVEGMTTGTAADGTPWEAGRGAEGRWCDVVDVAGGRIRRLSIYLDPDYASADTERYPWLAREREPAPAPVVGAATPPASVDDGYRRALAVEYFRRLDRGESVLDLFSPHAEVFFPKWGVARGHAEIARLFGDVGSLYTEVVHFPEYLNVVVDGDHVAVEGLTKGVAADGTPWRAGQSHAGRWCDVFEIRAGGIDRCFIYLDPDYAGADTERYPWLGSERPATRWL